MPAAEYDPAAAPAPPPGSAASVPADLDPARDAWAKQNVQVDIKAPPPPGVPAGSETRVAQAEITPTTGAVQVNGQPLPASPADVPKHVIVCKPVDN